LPDAGTTDSAAVTTFAVDTILLGDQLRDGDASAGAWMEFGYDIDGLTTTQTSSDVCTLASGAPQTVQSDGDEGTDNAAGAVLLPLLGFYAGLQPSADATTSLQKGSWTLQIQVRGLPADAQQAATGLSAEVFVSGALGVTPTFAPDLQWPVLPSSLNDNATIASGARVHFSTVYVTNGTLVAMGSTEPLTIPLLLGGHLLTLRVHQPILTFAHNGTEATDGVIAGVLHTDEVVSSGRTFAEHVASSDCGSNWDSYATAIAEAQDILSDGTNVPGVPCDAISVGVGFTAKVIANPTQVGVDLVPDDPCGTTDGGADALSE